MGYSMSWARVIRRNRLEGGYETTDALSMLRGDLRRLEQDERDCVQVEARAKKLGIPPEHVKAVLDDFMFGEGREWEGPPWPDAKSHYPEWQPDETHKP